MKITNEGWAIVERDSHLGRWVEEHKRLDFDQNALPQMLPYIKPDSIVLDIGANIGCYSHAFSSIAKKVFCFEPSNEAWQCLKFNMRNNTKCELYNCAIADERFFCEIISENDNVGMNYIVKSEKVSISTTTIDLLEEDGAFVDNSGNSMIKFIKIDVEGYELHTLKGAVRTILNHKPVMVIEINDHTLKRTNTTREEIFKWLTDHGYTFRNIYAEQGLQDDQLDIICLPS